MFVVVAAVGECVLGGYDFLLSSRIVPYIAVDYSSVDNEVLQYVKSV